MDQRYIFFPKPIARLIYTFLVFVYVILYSIFRDVTPTFMFIFQILRSEDNIQEEHSVVTLEQTKSAIQQIINNVMV